MEAMTQALSFLQTTKIYHIPLFWIWVALSIFTALVSLIHWQMRIYGIYQSSRHIQKAIKNNSRLWIIIPVSLVAVIILGVAFFNGADSGNILFILTGLCFPLFLLMGSFAFFALVGKESYLNGSWLHSRSLSLLLTPLIWIFFIPFLFALQYVFNAYGGAQNIKTIIYFIFSVSLILFAYYITVKSTLYLFSTLVHSYVSNNDEPAIHRHLRVLGVPFWWNSWQAEEIEEIIVRINGQDSGRAGVHFTIARSEIFLSLLNGKSIPLGYLENSIRGIEIDKWVHSGVLMLAKELANKINKKVRLESTKQSVVMPEYITVKSESSRDEYQLSPEELKDTEKF